MDNVRSDLRNALPMGTIVRGYELEALLGHGGFSVVYRARHVELGHLVAVKEYLPVEFAVREGWNVLPRSTECVSDYEAGKRRFVEEARRIVQFKDDPGVVSCLDYFSANGTAYIVLEHIEGMSLAELLSKREAAGHPLNEPELLSLVRRLLESLSRLHRADVLHRDIKPSNILVRRVDGQPVLIDFGAAKQEAALRTKSKAPYTDGYAALEQVGEGELGPWTDIYAVGAVMWRVIAGGSPPWDPPNPKKVEWRASAILTGKHDPLPSAVELGKGRFASNLLVAVDKCLKIQGNERMADCDRLRMALGEAESSPESPIATTPHGGRRQSPRPPIESKAESPIATMPLEHAEPATLAQKPAVRSVSLPYGAWSIGIFGLVLFSLMAGFIGGVAGAAVGRVVGGAVGGAGALSWILGATGTAISVRWAVNELRNEWLNAETDDPLGGDQR